MKYKKRFLLVGLFLLCFQTLPVSAAKGTVQIQMPSELSGQEVHYEINGEQVSSYTDVEGILTVQGLDAGMYEIKLEKENFEFMPMEIPIPMWDVDKEQMEYDISVIPKYSRLTPVPQTGDEAPIKMFALVGMAACTLIMTMLAFRKKRRE